MSHAAPSSDVFTAPQPPVPETIDDTGLSPEAVSDLILKTLYVQGARTGKQLVDVIRLPFDMVDERLLTLQQARIVEVRRTTGAGRGGYVFDLAGEGRARAREALEASQYVGPAPIPLNAYREWVDKQSIRNLRMNREHLAAAFSELVLAPEMIEALGPAVNSAKSLFLYGAPGNGKTRIAELIARLASGTFFLPYAVDIDGQIMAVYDPVHHKAAPEPEPEEDPSGEGPLWLRSVPDYDRRFVLVKRPVVITGGELTLDQLDLQYDRFTKMYQAPFQVKANGGVLIVDDFGRQRVPPHELLNRWIVPLEKRIDYLTLHTGVKFSVPFDCLLILGTNLDPKDLVDEAFMRRIHYKIHVPSPERSQFDEIFRRCCADRGIEHSDEAVEYLYREYYGRLQLEPRACHPRDLLDHICDEARFEQVEATLSTDLIDRACGSYFLNDLNDAAEFGTT
jgi:predicted ATPase with chaperone activity